MTTILTRKTKSGKVITWTTSGNFKGGKIDKTCLFCEQQFKVFLYRKDAKYCSKKCLAKHKTNENSKNWKGGITSETKKIRASEDYNNWRKLVYARDNWTCQHCFIKQKYPVAHHIKTFKDYPELRFEVDNGMTLCRSCHKKEHQEIGLLTQFKKMKNNITKKVDAANGFITIA